MRTIVVPSKKQSLPLLHDCKINGSSRDSLVSNCKSQYHSPTCAKFLEHTTALRLMDTRKNVDWIQTPQNPTTTVQRNTHISILAWFLHIFQNGLVIFLCLILGFRPTSRRCCQIQVTDANTIHVTRQILYFLFH